jgi:hypothetical protein
VGCFTWACCVLAAPEMVRIMKALADPVAACRLLGLRQRRTEFSTF